MKRYYVGVEGSRGHRTYTVIDRVTGQRIAEYFERSTATRRAREENSKRKNRPEKRAPKRISAALTRYLRKMNPGKMKGVTQVRVKRLKGGGVTITPVR